MRVVGLTISSQLSSEHIHKFLKCERKQLISLQSPLRVTFSGEYDAGHPHSVAEAKSLDFRHGLIVACSNGQHSALSFYLRTSITTVSS